MTDPWDFLDDDPTPEEPERAADKGQTNREGGVPAERFTLKETLHAPATEDAAAAPEESAAEQPAEVAPKPGGGPLRQYVDDWQAVRAEQTETMGRATKIDGQQWVHRGGDAALDPARVSELLRALGAVAGVAQRLSTPREVLRVATERNVLLHGNAYAAVADLTVTGEGYTLTLTTGSGAADRQAIQHPKALDLTAMLWHRMGAPALSRATDRDDGRVVVHSKPFDAAAHLAQYRIKSRLPRLYRVATDLNAWQRVATEAGLYVEDRKPDGGVSRTYARPDRFHLTRSDTACVVFKTPPRVTQAQWERALPVMQTALGDAGLYVEQIGAGEVGMFPARPVARPAPYIPTAAESLHIAQAPSEVEAYAAALAAYQDLHWTLGRTPQGQVLGDSMKHAPHALVAGGTGAGKSTWTSWLATTMVSAGADLVICDGKSGADYDGIVKALPNVLMYTKHPVEHVAALQWLADEMEQRYQTVSKRSLAGAEDREPFRPIVAVFDEYGAFKKALTSGDGGALSADVAVVDRLVTAILQKARAVRIHLVFVAQTIYAETLPGEQKGNVPVRLSLGVPSAYTLQQVAGGAYEEAAEIAKTIPKGKPGLGVTMAVDDGENSASLVSVPYGFVPGAKAGSPGVQRVWDEVEREAFDGLVTLTPRIALMHDAPADPADRGKKVPEPEHWQEYGVHEIRQLPWVRVTPWRGRDPVPGAEKYDLLNAGYTGNDRAAGGANYH